MCRERASAIRFNMFGSPGGESINEVIETEMTALIEKELLG
jgi:hypothetical protein